MNSWNHALSGGILIGYWAAGLFFFHFQRRTKDSFFSWFGWAFWLLAAERVLLVHLGSDEEAKTYVYLFRLVAFLFILFAILQKNQKGNKSFADDPAPKNSADPAGDRT
jgi:hypothetical protein